MAAHRYRDLIAWQVADGFKREVVAIVKESRLAREDLRFRSQLLESSRSISKNIAEGFLRFSDAQFVIFLDYEPASLGEAEERLRDGIELDYYSAARCAEALRFAKRCMVATIRLKLSQIHRIRERNNARRKSRQPEKEG